MGNCCRRRSRPETPHIIEAECFYEESPERPNKFFVTERLVIVRQQHNNLAGTTDAIRMTSHDRRDLADLRHLEDRLLTLKRRVPQQIRGLDDTLSYIRATRQ